MEESTIMNIRRVRIIYNKDGAESYTTDEGEVIEYGDLGENVIAISEALAKEGIDTHVTELTSDGFDDFVGEVSEIEYDEVVFNLCEAAFGQSEYEMNVAALFELYGVMFTGSGAMTLGMALNKGWTKDVLVGAGLPTPRHKVLAETDASLIGEKCEGLSFPLIVKPVSEDASIGIDNESVVNDEAALIERVKYVFDEYWQSAIVEEYIEGREFNISVLGNGAGVRALPPSEIDFSSMPAGTPKICSYEAKWIETSPLYQKSPPICPANVSEELLEKLHKVSVEAYNVMGCRDYARVDLRVATDGSVYVLEVNPNPDISTDAGLARAAGAAGLDYGKLILAVVESAYERYDQVTDADDADEAEEDGAEQGSEPDPGSGESDAKAAAAEGDGKATVSTGADESAHSIVES